MPSVDDLAKVIWESLHPGGGHIELDGPTRNWYPFSDGRGAQ